MFHSEKEILTMASNPARCCGNGAELLIALEWVYQRQLQRWRAGLWVILCLNAVMVYELYSKAVSPLPVTWWDWTWRAYFMVVLILSIPKHRAKRPIP